MHEAHPLEISEKTEGSPVLRPSQAAAPGAGLGWGGQNSLEKEVSGIQCTPRGRPEYFCLTLATQGVADAKSGADVQSTADSPEQVLALE